MFRSLMHLITILITCSLLLVSAGCRPAPDPVPDPPDDPEPDKVTVTLYFADEQAVQTGDGGELGFLKPVVREIEPTEDMASALISELISGPRPEDEGVDRTVPTSAVIKDVQVKDGVATVNFTPDFWQDYSGGTLGGSLFMGSMIYTLTELDEVSRVLVLVDGEPWSDGHYYWDEPMARDD